MPTDTLTAQQLWDQTDNYRREGGPEMPEDLSYRSNYQGIGDNPSTKWMLTTWPQVPMSEQIQTIHAAAILRDHGLMWLLNNGWNPQICRDSGTGFLVSFHQNVLGITAGFRLAHGPSVLAAINAAIGAVLDEREGK